MKPTELKSLSANAKECINKVKPLISKSVSLYRGTSKVKKMCKRPKYLYNAVLCNDVFFRNFIDFMEKNKGCFNVYDDRTKRFLQLVDYEYNKIKRELNMSNIEIFKLLVKSLSLFSGDFLLKKAEVFLHKFFGIYFVYALDNHIYRSHEPVSIRYSVLFKDEAFDVVFNPIRPKYLVPPPGYNKKHFFNMLYNKFALQIGYFIAFTSLSFSNAFIGCPFNSVVIEINSNHDIKVSLIDKNRTDLSSLRKIISEIDLDDMIKNAYFV